MMEDLTNNNGIIETNDSERKLSSSSSSPKNITTKNTNNIPNDEKKEEETEEIGDTIKPLRMKSYINRNSTTATAGNLNRISTTTSTKTNRPSLVRIESVNDYLRLQKMQSARRFNKKSFLIGGGGGGGGNRNSSFRGLPLEESSEFGTTIQDSERNSSTRRIASTQGVSHLAQSSDWVEFLDHVHDDTDDDDDLLSTEDNHQTPFYSRPYQRQRWGAKQVLPHINWADLFFDLFFVALASNLGIMLITVMESSTDMLRGLIYFIGCFGPLFNVWENKTKYEARYTVSDHAHQIFDILRFFVVGFAVLHVKSMTLLTDPKSIETFLISFCLFVESILSWVQNLELYFFADGDRTAIQNNAKRKIIQNSVFDAFYLAATLLSGVMYLSDGYDDHHYDNDDNHAPIWELSDLPLTLCCASYLLRICSQIGISVYHNSHKRNDFQNYFVPHNIEYLIHRYGEWVMLMIGESVLALLIVDTTESSDYYAVTSIGILTVTILQILKYESEPHKPSRHALLRSTTSGLFYSISIQLFSMTLIAFGISFKIFLIAIFNEEGSKDTQQRFLAGSSSTTVIAADTAAWLYCISLTLVLLSLELLHISHSSIQQTFSVFLVGSRENRKLKWPLFISGSFKFLLMSFVATLSLWQTDPVFLTASGWIVTCLFAVSRVLLTGFKNSVRAESKGIANEPSEIILEKDRQQNGITTSIPIDGVVSSTST